MKNLFKCSWTALTVGLVFSIKAAYLFYCFSGLEFLHTKCNMVHSDLSINNIVIYRTPLSHPPNTLSGNGIKAASAQRTQASLAAMKAPAMFTPAPKEGLTETIPATGIVIDYDYTCKIGTTAEKTSVHPCHFLACSILNFMIFALGYLAFHATCLSGQKKSRGIYPQSCS